MKTPGPDHPITIEAAKNRWRARFAGHVIADSNDALILREADYPARVYFPRQDVAMEYMSRTDRSTHCPYKGDAAYYTLLMDGQFAENAIWTYELPYPAMEPIAERLSFYPDKVEIYEVADAAVNPRHVEELHDSHRVSVDEVVQHTDAGDGAAQRERWTPDTRATNDDGDDGLR
ncbi:DUF427 domain-containing protein [Phenylobacterium sp.]|jgi:uncharacterized protein (DUF427 family)|uniref:DUF427 domain-containing protein n=1 Tax=Phenylobacterium sp. TaxID=1871053 RepID=UPI002E30D5DE|nr:DUF427 domain-containing protein [Phenylobacterium sp.]HEX4713162.1 DUF427 domain-containing protein [Phenylobacterium sp.]